MSVEEIYSLYLAHPNIVTDTRQDLGGAIFFALKGPSFNGNDFAKSALDRGASFVVVDEDLPFNDPRIIRTKDVLCCLQDLAKHHRQQFSIPFIAITGSNGKTTTKELVHAVLATTYRTYTTEGNLNNHIGIPLTILKIRKDAGIAVIEMGANHQKEIENYCTYAQPTHGLITNIGKAHLEGFGGLEGVKKGKGELFAYLAKTNGTAFVFEDDPSIAELTKNIKNTVFYGSQRNHALGRVLSADPYLSVNISETPNFDIRTKLVGSYNLPNVLAAYCIGKYFQVPEEKIREAIGNYEPANSRSQLLEKDSNTIILDAYNANPGSMKLAIENFAAMEGKKKILLLGDMKELGPHSEAEHREIVNLVNQFPWHAVVLVGQNFKNIPSDHHHFNNSEEAQIWFQKKAFKHALVLIKGSRSMQMEKIIS